jgi:hypothetical protein
MSYRGSFAHFGDCQVKAAQMVPGCGFRQLVYGPAQGCPGFLWTITKQGGDPTVEAYWNAFPLR